MRNFKFLSLLAIIATFTSVFAAWELNSYATSYMDAAGMAVSVITNIENKEALSVEITNTDMPTIIFDAGVASVSDDISIKVTANVSDEDISKYKYYYTLYAGVSVPELSSLTVYEPNGTVPATSEMVELTLSENGTADLSKEVLAAYLVPDVDVAEAALQDFSDNLNASKTALNDEGHIGILIYAEKSASNMSDNDEEIELGPDPGYSEGDNAEWE